MLLHWEGKREFTKILVVQREEKYRSKEETKYK
jgi:hypothetical protein